MKGQTSQCSCNGDFIFYLYYKGKCKNFPDARVTIDDMVAEVDKVAFRITIKDTENRKFTGYCQLQGLYLAAKRYGQLDVFYAAKSAVSNNILPNF